MEPCVAFWFLEKNTLFKIVSGTVLMTIPENLHLLDCSRAKITHKDTVVVEIICRFTVDEFRLCNFMIGHSA